MPRSGKKAKQKTHVEPPYCYFEAPVGHPDRAGRRPLGACSFFGLFIYLFYLFWPFYYKAAVFAHPTDATGEKSPAPPGLVDRPRALGFLPALRVTQAGTGILLSHFLSWRMLSWRGTAIVFA